MSDPLSIFMFWELQKFPKHKNLTIDELIIFRVINVF